MDSHSDNDVEVTHVQQIDPTDDNRDSKVKEKKEQESIKNSSDSTANAANHQLQNQESSYARCKPMAPSKNQDRKERCKSMAPIKPKLKYTSSEQIDPKMGHLKRAYMAVNTGELAIAESINEQAHLSDWTKVTLQHPQACTVKLTDTFDHMGFGSIILYHQR